MIISSLPQGVQGRYGHIMPLTPLVLIPWHSIFVYTEYSTDDYSNCVLAYTTGRANIVKPQRACTRVTVVVLCVCLSVCVSVTALAAIYLVYMSKVMWHIVSCRLLKICIVWISLKKFPSGDMASFA